MKYISQWIAGSHVFKLYFSEQKYKFKLYDFDSY